MTVDILIDWFTFVKRRAEKVRKAHYGYLLNTDLSQCHLFLQLDKQNKGLYNKLRNMYENSFANITFGELLKFDETISSLNFIGKALSRNNNLPNISFFGYWRYYTRY